MFRNNSIQVVEQKLLFYESLSKDVSIEFKKIIEKLSDGNAQIGALVTKQDIRINNLDNTTLNISQDLKAISTQIEIQNSKQDTIIAAIHASLKDVDSKIFDLLKFKTTIMWSLTAIVTIVGILASAGWMTPDRFINKNTIQTESK